MPQGKMVCTKGELAFHLSHESIPFSEGEVESSIPRRFEKIVRRYPDRPAVRYHDQHWSYRTLNCIANGIAHTLLARLGMGPEPVILLFEQGLLMTAAIFGVLKTGKMYVPLDPEFPPERLVTMGEDAAPRLVLTNSANRPLARTLVPDESLIFTCDTLNSRLPVENPGLPVLPHTPAYLLYTSGSTGQPKGVVQNHRNVLCDIRRQSQDLHISSEDRFGLLFSYCSSTSVSHIFGALLNGATVLPFAFRAEGFVQLAEWLEREAVTILDLNVSTFRRFMAGLPAGRRFASVRLLALGGEPVHKTDVEAYRQHFSADCMLQNALGTTETRTIAQYFIGQHTQIKNSTVPVGYDVAGKQVLLLDEMGNEVAPGEIGEIVVKSHYLSPGYWRKPELTQAVFQEDPAGSGERLYFTGDLGRKQPDGCLSHAGRKDLQVKIRGFRVEIAEIEVALKSLEGIEDAVAVTQEDALNNKQLVAYLVPKSGFTSSVKLKSLRNILSDKLPSYMIPARFVFLRTLPHLPNGKIDRHALPVPPTFTSPTAEAHVPPKTPLELQLARIWEEVLGVEPIGLKDNFFDLGGDSLLAASLLSHLEEALSCEVSVAALLESPTLEQLARRLDREITSLDTTSLIIIQPGTHRPPFFCIPGVDGNPLQFLRLARCFGAAQPIFAIQPQGFEGRVAPLTSVEAIAAQALQVICAAHPAGPYFLGGFSMGGLVALEVAQQLAASGKPVALLALLDTHLPQERQPSWQEWLANRFAFHLHECATSDFIGSLSYLRQRFIGITNESWRRLGVSFCAVLDQLYLRSSRRVPRSIRTPILIKTNIAAVRPYVPRPYPGRITFFRAVHNRAMDRENGSRWERLAQGGIEVHEVPGGHTILAEPGVQVLAEKLRACLDVAAGQTLRLPDVSSLNRNEQL
ncbi:MAG: amino acid adenylation domain-containing protein [Deltaproteobacteria bacterium]|nr:amino acid adenylation domain-containing protein [Deltaproteobacteria bacterium]